MIPTTLLLGAGLLGAGLFLTALAAALLRRVNGGDRYDRITRGPGRRDHAQDVYWETRALAALNGNRAALRRSVVSRQRHNPGLKRWELLRLVYLDVTRRHTAPPRDRRAAPRGGVFRTHF